VTPVDEERAIRQTVRTLPAGRGDPTPTSRKRMIRSGESGCHGLLTIAGAGNVAHQPPSLSDNVRRRLPALRSRAPSVSHPSVGVERTARPTPLDPRSV